MSEHLRTLAAKVVDRDSYFAFRGAVGTSKANGTLNDRDLVTGKSALNIVVESLFRPFVLLMREKPSKQSICFKLKAIESLLLNGATLLDLDYSAMLESRIHEQSDGLVATRGVVACRTSKAQIENIHFLAEKALESLIFNIVSVRSDYALRLAEMHNSDDINEDISLKNICKNFAQEGSKPTLLLMSYLLYSRLIKQFNTDNYASVITSSDKILSDYTVKIFINLAKDELHKSTLNSSRQKKGRQIIPRPYSQADHKFWIKPTSRLPIIMHNPLNRSIAFKFNYTNERLNQSMLRKAYIASCLELKAKAERDARIRTAEWCDTLGKTYDNPGNTLALVPKCP